MKRIKKGIIIFLLILIPGSVGFQSCEDIIPLLLEMLFETGWLADNEKMDNIPEDITPFDDGGSNNLANSVSLESKFPPIGDQGKYGTCVAWSVGYNLKTALNAIEKGWTATDLAKTSNQTSPLDLWMCIPTAQRGSGCNGTNFEPALDAIISKGVKSLESAPYTTTINCSGTTGGNDNNKLANYRKIASETQGLTVDNFKGYLNAGRPIAIGAKLGDNFMNWKTNGTIRSDTYNNPGMQHAYHAMALVGYDNDKQAFRVRNSWGTEWGDKGSIWVDYEFFCNSFCFAAFVAQNPNTGVSIGNPPTSGSDLMAFFAEDYELDEVNEDCPTCNREFYYDVFNSGTTIIRPSQKWRVTYMYYNARNAKDYKIIYEDYFTDEYSSKEGEFGELENSNAIAGGYWNHFTVKPGENVGEFVDEDGETYSYVISYKMPNISGSYYLVVMADAFDVIREVNEDNNFYFITADNGKPLEFKNGKILNMPESKAAIQRSSAVKRPERFANTEHQTTVAPGNLNAYTPTEIKTMLLHEKKTGRLDIKRKAFGEENQYGRKYLKKNHDSSKY